jgi:hypothetical protein
VLGPNIPPRQVWRLRPPVDSPSRACLRSAGRPAGFFRRARSLVARVHACARSLAVGLVRRDQTVHFPATSVASLRQGIYTGMHLVIRIARVLTQAYCAPRHQTGELDIRGHR